jgi:type IV secretion system protein VirB4
MTLANSDQSRLLPWYAKAGAASSIVPLARWVSPAVFALKNGGYGIAASVAGMDEESLTDQELESRTRTLQGALRGLPEGACLYQYSRVLSGYEIPRKASYGDPVLDSFVNDRLSFLNENAGFRRIDLFWCLTVEPSQTNPLDKKPKDAEADNIRRLAMLRKTASILETQISSSIGFRVLNKDEAFPFFSYLFNLEPWADHAALATDTGLDRQIVRSPIAIEGDHLRVGKRYVQMFTLMNNPEVSRPCQFSGLMTLDCDSVLCTTWRPKSAAKARAEISQQEKFISFFKVGVLSRVMSGRDTASLEDGAGARAANLQANQLDGTSATNSEVQQLNLVNAAQAQQLNEQQAQGALHACIAQQMTVQNMQQRNAMAHDLNLAANVQAQRAANPTGYVNSTSTYTDYLP